MELFKAIKNKEKKIAVVGLGYVGLPLAMEFGKIVPTIGFDTKRERIRSLQEKSDSNMEVTEKELEEASYLEFSDDSSSLKDASFIVVAVPTPITKKNVPDLSCMIKASTSVGKNLAKGSIVVYESTVYPGVTEDVCVPILERESGLICGKDFKVGYSPERINPGDKEHTISNILKIVSGQDKDSLDEIAAIYELVIKAGVYKADSIKTAEAAKVIENTQRDLNIALVNELAILFDKMNIDTKHVLDAAATKWNFIKMSPGLVGGHCIGVDPYYLTYRAEELGYIPQIILAGRRINNGMGKYIAEQAVKHLIKADKTVNHAKVLVMGITFKENVSDIRNSKVIDVIQELKDYGISVCVADPLADKEEVKREYDIDLIDYDVSVNYDAMILCVAHDEFKKLLTKENISKQLNSSDKKGVLIDIKWLFDKDEMSNSDINYWRL